VTFIDEEDQKEPWKRSASVSKKLVGPMPKSLTVTLANRLIRLAAFQNPEFYKKQAMRFSVWDEPRVIGCAENYPYHIALPRGCLDAALELLRDNAIGCELIDERYEGSPLEVAFAGTLRLDQEFAVAAMLHHDAGVLCAPTAFGKTVTAAAMIARRGVNTLVLTERTEHLDAIQTVLDGKVPSLFVLHGRIAKKQRATLIAELNALPPEAARVLLATGKLVGEGFDHPPLDTLVLAMPVSWKGTLQQYAGRLHREHASKTDVRIIDFVDTGHPALLRMWEKRQRGYRAMGYRIAE
jgi:superfamily II DNA or RNA helicase